MTLIATPSMRYWTRVRWVTWSLSGVWLAVTVALPWFAKDLNAWQVGGFPLGYGMSAHGAILFFLLLLVIDVLLMGHIDRLERRDRQRASAASGGHA